MRERRAIFFYFGLRLFTLDAAALPSALIFIRYKFDRIFEISVLISPGSSEQQQHLHRHVASAVFEVQLEITYEKYQKSTESTKISKIQIYLKLLHLDMHA